MSTALQPEKKPRRAKGTVAAERTAKASPEARRAAAAILEVWGGVRTPQQAASALGLSVPRYYQIEQRAVGAIVASCEPRPRGPAVGGERRVRVLERQLAAGRRDLSRLQALLRTSQRTIGLPLAEPAKGPAKPAAGGKKRRSRRPTARSLKLAATLATDSPGENSDAGVERPQDTAAGETTRVVSPAAPDTTGGSP